MSGITAIGTTFNEPNYHGELFALTPTDTPLLSMSGGLGGGRQTSSTQFEWQTYDLRDPQINPRLEGADAPDAEARVRANVTNVVQIYTETVGTSYTKQATTAQLNTTEAAPWFSTDGLGGGNPVVNEHTWQVAQALTQIARDVNFSFWHAKKNVPTDNSTARQTAGLLSVLTTNKSFAAAEQSGSAATDTITSSATVANGDQLVFTDPGGATNVRLDRSYYVVSKSTGTFKVATTAGGTGLTLGTVSALKFVMVGGTGATDVSVDSVNALVQGIFDNGGLVAGASRTLFVPSIQKTRLTKAYATAYGSNVNGAIGMSTGHTVGGVSVDTIITDFGQLNLVVDRALPKDCIVAVSMEQVSPVFLSIPGKGVLFEEALAKTGAVDKTQIYGEIGLAYGSESAHGVLRGLSIA